MRRPIYFAIGLIAWTFVAGCGDGSSQSAPDAAATTADAQGAGAEASEDSEASQDSAASDAAGSNECIAAGGECIAADAVCWGTPLSAACGGRQTICCRVVFDAGGGCNADASSRVVAASSYDQSCAVDTDCVAISEGNACNPCDFSCVNAAINARDHAKYASDTANFPAVLAAAQGVCPSSCGGPEGVCCRGGTCVRSFECLAGTGRTDGGGEAMAPDARVEDAGFGE